MKKFGSFLLLALMAVSLMGLKGPLFRSGSSVYLTGVIDGDVYLAGGEVIVDAEINGDLLVAGGQVDVRGRVRDDVRVIGGQVQLNGLVGDDVTLVAGQAETTPTSTISSSLVSVGGLIIDGGYTAGPAYLLGGRVRVNGVSADQMTVYAESFEALPEASISGNLTVHYGESSTISPKAQVLGTVTTERAVELTDQSREKVRQISFWVLLQQATEFLMYAVLGWLLILFLPQLFKSLNKLSQTHTGSVFGWGVLGLLGFPFLGLLLILSLIGIPLGVLVFILYGLTWVFARLLAAVILGSKLLNDPDLKKPTPAFLVGLGLLMIVKIIPVFGWLAYFFLMLLSLGAVTLKFRTWLYAKLKR